MTMKSGKTVIEYSVVDVKGTVAAVPSRVLKIECLGG
jgi:hypothetical protein